MNNYIIFTTFLTLGLFLLIKGIFSYRKFHKINEIISFKLEAQNTEVFLRRDKYTIAIIGGANVKKLPISITSVIGGNMINIFENALKYKFLKDGTFGVDYCNFTIVTEGKYNIFIREHEVISVDHSVPLLLPLGEKILPEHLHILVKQYSSPLKYIESLILCFFGLGIFMLSVVFILYKIGILVPTK